MSALLALLLAALSIAAPAPRSEPDSGAPPTGANPTRGWSLSVRGQTRTGAPMSRVLALPDRPAFLASAPHTGIGTALFSGAATWYGTSGPGLYAAAGPDLRAIHGWRGDKVRVCARHRCIVVPLTDACYCRAPKGQARRILDLSADAFRRLAPLSSGVIRVEVEWLGPAQVPPPTDTAR